MLLLLVMHRSTQTINVENELRNLNNVVYTSLIGLIGAIRDLESLVNFLATLRFIFPTNRRSLGNLINNQHHYNPSQLLVYLVVHYFVGCRLKFFTFSRLSVKLSKFFCR